MTLISKVLMSKELLSSIMAEIKINFSYSYFDFALFKVSPRPIRIMLTRTVILRKHHLCFSNQYTRIACIHKQSGVLGLIRISVYWFQLNTTLQIYVKNKKIKMIISYGWIDEIICIFCKNWISFLVIRAKIDLLPSKQNTTS